MTIFAFKDLRCDVVGCSTDRPLPIAIKLELGSQTKVTDLDLHFVIDEQVAELETGVKDLLSVNDFVGVHVLEGGHHLNAVGLDLQLVQPLASSQDLVEGLVGAELQQDVHVVVVLEEVLEADHMLVLQ